MLPWNFQLKTFFVENFQNKKCVKKVYDEKSSVSRNFRTEEVPSNKTFNSTDFIGELPCQKFCKSRLS